MTTSGAARPASRTPKLESRNFGSQNRKKSHTGSVIALPTMNAQVWRRPSSARHGVFSIDSIGARCGARYSVNQRTSHSRSSAPVAMNAQRHPSQRVIAGTSSAATITPTLLPALKIPVASARSFCGNHSATALTAAGKFPDSPAPSRARATPKPATVRARACPMAARLQTSTASASPKRTPIRSMTRPMTRSPKP